MKGLAFTICSLVITFSAFAQQNTYETIKIKAVENLRSGDFASAKSRLNLMEPYIDDSNRNEYQSLLNQLQDSINNSYNKANALREKKQYEIAIIEYQRLIKDKEPLVKPLYAHIGYCYEVRSANNENFKKLARDNYQLGIQHNENLSALRMAWFIRENNISATTEEMIELYEKAPNYYAAMDSLGVEYGRLGRLNESYKWYRKSQTNFSKYSMAVYLLDTSTYTQLSEDYRTDDPIKLLTEAADDGYAPAQYYLGILYYYAKDGERVQRDKAKGMELMQRAASSKYAPAEKKVQTIIELEGRYQPSSRIIHKKTPWEKFVDTFTPEDETWGISSSYSKQFPITIAANRTWSVFSLGCEIGVDLKGDRYINEQYNPVCYFNISPGAYFKYISINCGIGSLLSSYEKVSTLIKGDSYTDSFEGESDDGCISVNGSVTIITISQTKTKWDFVFKPSITGYIPICDEYYYITINAGYNYIPKFKELNGWSFGIGFQWVI